MKRECDDDFPGQLNGDDFDDSSSFSSAAETSTAGSGEIGLTERLSEILVDEGDGDLLLQRTDREDRVLQWLQALDVHVTGACRDDERLKPLLKLNASDGVAEDRLLSYLSQHFDPLEVGMLARCFCIPLVSVRVGKINKQGNLFCPTSARGNLSLSVLPTSDLRLTFIGDNGTSERLFTLSGKAHGSAVVVEEIPADSSGRSFQIKVAGGRVFNYWCCEKSKLLGIELISKMKDILKRKPSVANLTGISKSRLDCFANHIRSYLAGISNKETAATASSSFSCSANDLSASTSSRSLKLQHRSRDLESQPLKTNPHYKVSLSPRSSSFKEGMTRSLSSLRNVAREKLHRREDSCLSALDSLVVTLPSSTDASYQPEIGNTQEVESFPVAPLSCLGSLAELDNSEIQSSTSSPTSLTSPIFSPYYSWCPLGGTSVQFSSKFPESSISSIQTPLLPPFSSLMSTTSSSALAPLPHLGLPGVQSLDLPALFPGPLVRVPITGSQQIPTFNPLICDPIVHIPVIDICSSGPGYLVSAGPAVPGTIPPFHSKLAHPITSETESALEAGARETLRLLISSSTNPNPQLMNVFPGLYATAADDDQKQGILGVGSRGLRAIDSIASNMATLGGLITMSQSSIGEGGLAGESNGMDEAPSYHEEALPFPNLGDDA
ncbi:hypothetical protein LINPERPRIM_LOCUS9518 [Linum perenne]